MDTFRNTESHAHRDVTVLINDGEQTYEMMTKAVQVRDGKMHIQNLENFDDFCFNLLFLCTHYFHFITYSKNSTFPIHIYFGSDLNKFDFCCLSIYKLTYHLFIYLFIYLF